MIARLLLAALAALGLAACEPDASRQQRDWPAPSPAIWQVTAPGEETGWLFGTAHSLPDGVDWRSEEVDTAFAQAEVLVVEIANLADTRESFDAFRARAYAEGLPPLLDRAGPQRREAIAELVEQAGADPDDFAGMKSWAAAMTLAAGVRAGDPENGVDRALIAGGKPVIGLESFEAQYRLFDSLSHAEQADLLAGVAMEAREDRSAELTQAWLKGDADAIAELAAGGMLADPVLRETLLAGRNRQWVPRIAELIEQGRKPFVAVGAAHVAGEDGLAALLEERGFALRRL